VSPIKSTVSNTRALFPNQAEKVEQVSHTQRMSRKIYSKSKSKSPIVIRGYSRDRQTFGEQNEQNNTSRNERQVGK
jgi:hypothetical protein